MWWTDFWVNSCSLTLRLFLPPPSLHSSVLRTELGALHVIRKHSIVEYPTCRLTPWLLKNDNYLCYLFIFFILKSFVFSIPHDRGGMEQTWEKWQSFTNFFLGIEGGHRKTAKLGTKPVTLACQHSTTERRPQHLLGHYVSPVAWGSTERQGPCKPHRLLFWQQSVVLHHSKVTEEAPHGTNCIL